MSIITKTAAKEVALKLTEKKAKAVSDMQLKFEEYCTELTEGATPNVILELFKTHSNYLNSYSRVTFSGEGLAYGSSKKLTRHVPRPNQNVSLEPSAAKAYLKEFQKLEDAKAQYDKLIIDIEATLLGLKSYKNISEHFPEATPFLPNKISTAIAVDVSGLRNRLK